MSRHSRTDATVHDISRARIVQGLKALHAEFGVYEKCEHNHALNDPIAFEIAGIGMTCEDGLLDRICRHCCCDMVNGEYVQSVVCASEHKHLPGYSLCPTMGVVEGRDYPWRP